MPRFDILDGPNWGPDEDEYINTKLKHVSGKLLLHPEEDASLVEAAYGGGLWAAVHLFSPQDQCLDKKFHQDCLAQHRMVRASQVYSDPEYVGWYFVYFDFTELVVAESGVYKLRVIVMGPGLHGTTLKVDYDDSKVFRCHTIYGICDCGQNPCLAEGGSYSW
jgi:hypothetical protein